MRTTIHRFPLDAALNADGLAYRPATALIARRREAISCQFAQLRSGRRRFVTLTH